MPETTADQADSSSINPDQYMLAIEDTVEVPVKLQIKSKGVIKSFAFTYTATRMDQDQITERLGGKGLAKDFVRDVMKSWSGQRLVLDPVTQQPAEFSPGAAEALLNIAGVARVMFDDYLEVCGAKEKN